MKKDLLVATILVAIASVGIVGVWWWQSRLPADDGQRTVRPRTEAIAEKPIEPKKAPAPPKKLPILVAAIPTPKEEKKAPTELPVEKRPTPAEEKKAPVAADPPKKKDAPIAKSDPKVEPKENPKVEPKVPEKPEKKDTRPRVLAIDNVIQLNDPDGEFTVETINGGQTIILSGKVKTLKIAGLNEGSTLDATRLQSEGIVFLGSVNSASKVLLGTAQTLKLRDVNERSLIDGSFLSAREIQVTGALNGGATLKLHAPDGTIALHGDINDNAQVHLIAKNAEFLGNANGEKTFVELTLTKDGSLRFRRLNGGVRLHYQKAAPTDPEPRVAAGEVGPRAEFRKK